MEIAGINPIFYKGGYSIWGIGPELVVPDDSLQKANRHNITLNDSADPELFLLNRDSGKGLTIECKANSFGPIPTSSSHQSLQARSLLCLRGESVKDQVTGQSSTDTKWSNFLFYLLGPRDEDIHKKQAETLDELRDELDDAEIECIDASASCIIEDDGDLYLKIGHADGCSGYPEILSDSRVLISDNGISEEWITLSLIPWDPTVTDEPTELQERVIEERLRASLTSQIAKGASSSSFTIDLDRVLSETLEIWDLWRDSRAKQGFRKPARRIIDSLLKMIAEHVKSSDDAGEIRLSRVQDSWTVDQIGREEQKEIQRFISNADYRRANLRNRTSGDGIPSFRQLELFSDTQ